MDELREYVGGDYPLSGIIIALIIITLFITLLLYIVHLKNKLNNFENPKYGFLGKNIYPLVGFITLGAVILFASYGVIAPTPSDTQADLSLVGEIDANVTSQTTAIVNVNFNFKPYVGGQLWGVSGDEFDIYWEIMGREKYTHYELQKSASNPSGFNLPLPKDTYDIKITVVYNEKTYTFNDRISY